MVTICFKGGICLDFPEENIGNRRFFQRDTHYRLETTKDGKTVNVNFNGEDVLYVMAPNQDSGINTDLISS